MAHYPLYVQERRKGKEKEKLPGMGRVISKKLGREPDVSTDVQI